ncbi:hypothetical protein LC087_18805 (plasmid) [Bacillus carboniphilus]|uniref:Bacteriophage lambda Replication protein O N-terminal domain-containing protein n=1 Tax=Bacillus carboniphilus TaxID=86663 RepID=A0ABY9JYH2_9BACI|nr:hypothetical protein [Bacillus carboniphilus]WLR44434.1 hypothetical protein LC087_18805 [Bacillus carboniphilus]
MFKGFESPNYTQIPNEYLEYTFSHECDLTKVEMQIMNYIMRSTFGWQKSEYSFVCSVSDIQVLLNIQKRQVITNAMSRLTEEKKFLEKKLVGDLPQESRTRIEAQLKKKLKANQFLYRLNIIDNHMPWDVSIDPTSKITDMNERKESFNDKGKRAKSN